MATNNQKTDLLFKQFTGVVNASQSDSFSNSNNKFPFQPSILGQDVLIENIPNDLSNISYTNPDDPTAFVYGIHALDLSFQISNSPMGISYEIPDTPLIYYYKIELSQALPTTPRSFYIDDGTNSNTSLLKDSIPFLYDPIYKSYFQRVYTNNGTERINMYSGDLLWLFDYKSGFLQFYREPTSTIQNWIDTNGYPRISVIVYNGDKGLENFSGGGGGNVYNNLDVSGNISTNNLFMNLRQDNEGEINFIANNENISKIISTYDGSEYSIKFSILNNNVIEDRVTINKNGIDISGNISANNLSTYIQQNGNISLLNNDSGYIQQNNLSTYIQQNDNISLLYNDSEYIRPSDNININSNCNKAKYISYNGNHSSHYMSLGYIGATSRFKLYMEDSRGIEIDHAYTSDDSDYLKGHDNASNYSLYLTHEAGQYTRLKAKNSAESGNSVHVRYADAAGIVSTPGVGGSNYWKMVQDGFDIWFLYYNPTESLKAFIRHNGGNNTQLNFTGQHRCFFNNNITNDYIGLIVSVKENYINIDNNIKPTINDSLPYCEITKKYKDSKVFGVLSELEDRERLFGPGNFVSLYEKTNVNEHRFHINSIGEGSIWVCNYNGVINNGDYIVSSSVHGYGCKQDDDILHNYTVAKITCQCNFNLNLVSKKRVKTEKIITYIEEDVYENISENTQKKRIIFNEELERYVEESYNEITTKRELVYDEFDLYDENDNIIGKHKVNRKQNIEKEEQNIVYDENGDVVFEDDLDENGNIQYEYEYDTRFLDENANILSGEEEYLSRLNNGENVYIACFVGCSYHCG